MIKFRELLNYLLLNDGRVGFMGDSEYIDEEGEIRMGYWAFLNIVEDIHIKDNFTLDDEIDDSELLGIPVYAVENDNGQLCIVEFIYKEEY